VAHENTVNTQQEALNFVNKHGSVTLFPIKGVAFPSLYRATLGKNKEEKFNKTWSWADHLAQEKRIHYGKLIKKQVTLISLEMLPYFYRVHKRGQFKGTPQRILDFLKRHGPTFTTNLRRGLNLTGRENKSKFTKAMDQLQEAFAIAIVDREQSPKMLYTWDLLERWIPEDLLRKAETVSEKAAKERISSKLLENKVISKAEEAGKLLGWK
jgi:hypothetical protein